MPESHDLDAALESLARRAAGSAGRPGAAAAVRTVRTRRRRSVAGVAVVAAMAVAGVSTPQWLPADLPGVTARAPEPARLDAVALEHATAGWIDGWSAEDAKPLSFSAPDCTLHDGTAPDAATSGRSSFSRPDGGAALIVVHDFADEESLRRAWADHTSSLTSCPDFVVSEEPALPGGASLVHARGRYDTGYEPRQMITDVWVARTDDRLAALVVVTDAGPAPDEVADAVGQALLAGTASGWAEKPLSDPLPVH